MERFEIEGCSLYLNELDETERVAFKVGIDSLSSHVETVDTFAELSADFLLGTLRKITLHFYN